MTFVVAQAGVEQKWDWDVFWDFVPVVAEGMWVTVRATLAGFAIGIVLGLILALLRRSQRRLISWPAAAFIEFIRSTPLLVQLFFLAIVLPTWGITLSPFVALVIGLGIHYGTYTSEAYRAGIESVGRGQWEASVAMSLSSTTTWTRVILPQAIPTVIPALGNYLVAMLKDAPQGIAIGVVGIMGAARAEASQSLRFTEAYTTVGLIFLAVSVPLAVMVRQLEKRYGFERI